MLLVKRIQPLLSLCSHVTSDKIELIARMHECTRHQIAAATPVPVKQRLSPSGHAALCQHICCLVSAMSLPSALSGCTRMQCNRTHQPLSNGKACGPQQTSDAAKDGEGVQSSRHSKPVQGRLLGIQGPFIARLAHVAIDLSAGCDPNVQRNAARITNELEAEESRWDGLGVRGAGLGGLIVCVMADDTQGMSGSPLCDVV